MALPSGNCFLNGPTPASFSNIFGLSKQTIIFFTTQCEKMSCPSSIRRRELNPRPLEHALSPITSRPGLMPKPSGNCFISTQSRANEQKLRSLTKLPTYLPTYLPR